ncbi:MAG TPA: pitrilysin family protein [Bryobacteraceae bacterium]|jgi:zinc protease|nr:pitrilysin family protein [Bryobacteraceae bacterium]
MLAKLLVAVCFAAMLFGADAPRKVFPYAYSQEDLPNGLRLVTVPTDFPNIVATYIVVQTGSRNEVEAGHTGFAHLFEHLMSRGTQKYSPEKYEATLKQIGASSNAFTTDDFTCYHTTFSKEDLETVMAMESDRFRTLKYAEPEFKTETLAVLGEYNKNSSSPERKIGEVIADTAFDRHTYKHTTMGFLKDVQDMPNQYEYSLRFFDHYYRPEYTTIIVVGDVKPKAVRELIDKYWGEWKRGSYQPDIPREPVQDAPRINHVDWPSPTLPMLTVSYKVPAYTDTAKDTAALEALSFLAFSPTSELYQKLVIQEQKVDQLFADNSLNVDPTLFGIQARVKKAGDMEYVRDQILETIKTLRNTPVDAARLDAVRKHLRYQLALRMDNSDTIANILARYVALRRSPDTIDKFYAQLAQLTPADIQQAAEKYLTDNGRTIVTLTGARSAN